MNLPRWPALACLVFSIGCGSKSHAVRPIPVASPPVASTPVSPVITPTEAALGNAARAEVDGRPAEALTAYESMIVADPPVPQSNRLQALVAAARLRLSADPGLHDLAKARAHLLEAAGINPRLSATVPAMDLLTLIDQESEEQTQQDQRASVLRSENRSLHNTIKMLQEELARTQDELAKKDEALHRATEKLLEKAPRAH